MDIEKNRYFMIIAVGILTLSAVFVTIYFQTYEPYLNSDESSGIHKADSNQYFGDVHPPFGYAAQKLASFFLKTKFDYIIFNLLVLFPIFAFIVLKLNKLVFNNYLMGFLSLFILLSNSIFLYYELGSARIFYFLFPILNLICIYFFIKYLDGYITKDLVLFAVFTVMSIYTSAIGIETAFLLGLIYFSVNIMKKNTKRIITGLFLFLAFFLLSLPVIYSIVSHSEATSLKTHTTAFGILSKDTFFSFILQARITVIILLLYLMYFLYKKFAGEKDSKFSKISVFASFAAMTILFNFIILNKIFFVSSIERAFSYMFIIFYLTVFNLLYTSRFNYKHKIITLTVTFLKGLSILSLSLLIISNNTAAFVSINEWYDNHNNDIDDLTSNMNPDYVSTVFYYDFGGNSNKIAYSIQEKYNIMPKVLMISDIDMYGQNISYIEYPKDYTYTFVNLPDSNAYYLILGKHFQAPNPFNITQFKGINCQQVTDNKLSGLRLYYCIK